MMNNESGRFLHLLWASHMPAMLWWQTYVKAAETMVATPQVISHRTARLARSAATPHCFDHREFGMMWTEKLIAFSQSWINAATEMAAFQEKMLHDALSQWWAMADWFHPATALTVPWGRPSAPIDFLAACHRAMSIAPRLAHGVVKPVHAKAVRNAKRLRRGRG